MTVRCGVYTVDLHPRAYIVVTKDVEGRGYVPAVRVDFGPSYRAIPVFVAAPALKPWTHPLPDDARIWASAEAAQRTALTPWPRPGGSTWLA